MDQGEKPAKFDSYSTYLEMLGRVEGAVDDEINLRQIEAEARETPFDENHLEVIRSRCTQYLVDLEAIREFRRHEMRVSRTNR